MRYARIAAVMLTSACNQLVDIGSNGPVTLDGIVADHCGAPRGTVRPTPDETPSSALLEGEVRLTADWAICPGGSPPHGLTAAFSISKKPDGGLTAQALRKASVSVYVPDAPLGDVQLGYGTPSLRLTLADGTLYFVTFGDPLRMFLADQAHPSVIIAVYAAL